MIPSIWSRLNRWLDGLPRSHVLVGSTLVPAYLAWGLAGLVGGALVHLTLVASRGLPVGVAALADVVVCAGFVAYGLVRRRLVGREETVLLEHVLLATGLAAGTFALDARQLDAWIAGLCVFLASGRVGCTVGGCCHGHPSAIGIAYPHGHPAHGPRRFPVQLVEVAIWAALALVAAALPFVAPAGAAVGVVLASYGLARIGLESWRGDERRRVLGVTVGRVLALVALAIGLSILAVDRTDRIVAGAALLLGGAFAAVRGRWLTLGDPLGDGVTAGLPAAGLALRLPTGNALQVLRAGPLVIARSDDANATFVSLSRTPALTEAEARLTLAVLAAHAGSPDGLEPPREVQPGLFVAAWPPARPRRATAATEETAPVEARRPAVGGQTVDLASYLGTGAGDAEDR